ncbi:MAG: cell division topological specificity factor MinE [Clostridia bacterium]|nr:cell division topological specificity factor MinE [Clostridia bacterium]
MELREVFEPLVKFLKNLQRKDRDAASKDMAKERLQLVLMQDRASVSPDFFEMMKKEIIEVIKKYIEIDEESLEVQLTRGFEDGDGTGPALYANIPIKNIKPVAKKVEEKEDEELVTEVVNNETIVEEIAQEIKDNIAEATNAEVEVVATTETVMESKEEKNENVQSVEMKESNESSKEDEKNSLDTEIIKNSEEEKTQNIEEAVKDKFAEVKEGVTETIEKVKKGAKDGIKKIKTKAQKKKINE